MHLYREFPPHPALAAHVACLWTSHAVPMVCRFRRAHAALRSGAGDVGWAQLAGDCGYYDQSHLIHAFRQFADATPQSFVRPAP